MKEEPLRMHVPAHSTILSCQELTEFAYPVRYAFITSEESAGADVQGSTDILQLIIYVRNDPTYHYDYILEFDKQEVPVGLAYAITKSFQRK